MSKNKCYCVLEVDTNKIRGVYTTFENAIKMARAFHDVFEKDCQIQTVDYDFIDWDVYTNHIKKKVLDSRGQL